MKEISSELIVSAEDRSPLYDNEENVWKILRKNKKNKMFFGFYKLRKKNIKKGGRRKLCNYKNIIS